MKEFERRRKEILAARHKEMAADKKPPISVAHALDQPIPPGSVSPSCRASEPDVVGNDVSADALPGFSAPVQVKTAMSGACCELPGRFGGSAAMDAVVQGTIDQDDVVGRGSAVGHFAIVRDAVLPVSPQVGTTSHYNERMQRAVQDRRRRAKLRQASCVSDLTGKYVRVRNADTYTVTGKVIRYDQSDNRYIVQVNENRVLSLKRSSLEEINQTEVADTADTVEPDTGAQVIYTHVKASNKEEDTCDTRVRPRFVTNVETATPPETEPNQAAYTRHGRKRAFKLPRVKFVGFSVKFLQRLAMSTVQ